MGKTGLLLGLDGVGKTLLLRQLNLQLKQYHKSKLEKIRAFAQQHLKPTNTAATMAATMAVTAMAATASNAVAASASTVQQFLAMGKDEEEDEDAALNHGLEYPYHVRLGPSPYEFIVHQTQPTIGVEHTQLSIGSDRFSMCEIGGQLLPMWKAYYQSCDFWIFVFDVSNPTQLAGSVIEFFNVLQNPDMREKPKLILLNKNDAYFTIDDHALQSYLCLDQLFGTMAPPRRPSLSLHKPMHGLSSSSSVDTNPFHQNLVMIKVSAITGENIKNVIKWLAYQLHARDDRSKGSSANATTNQNSSAEPVDATNRVHATT